MICLNCGKEADAGAVFCTNCGKKLEEAPAVTQAEQMAAEEKKNDYVESVAAVQNTDAQSKSPYPYFEKKEEPVMSVVPEAPIHEKTYFGTGALVFCLVVIGILAITTGIFAGLYFSVV